MLELKYSHALSVNDNEPNRFVKHIDGSIYRYTSGDRKIKVGNFSVIILDLETAVNERESIFDLFDCDSRTIGYYEFYNDNLDFVPKVLKALGGDDRWAPNMLVLERLEILPKHRGRSYGLQVLRWLQLQFSMGCGIVVMKPFPLQFEGGKPAENKDKPNFVKLGLAEFDDRFEPALKKLRNYYARLGFVRVRGTEYMVADPFRRVPSLKAIGVSDSGFQTDEERA